MERVSCLEGNWLDLRPAPLPHSSSPSVLRQADLRDLLGFKRDRLHRPVGERM